MERRSQKTSSVLSVKIGDYIVRETGFEDKYVRSALRFNYKPRFYKVIYVGKLYYYIYEIDYIKYINISINYFKYSKETRYNYIVDELNGYYNMKGYRCYNSIGEKILYCPYIGKVKNGVVHYRIADTKEKLKILLS